MSSPEPWRAHVDASLVLIDDLEERITAIVGAGAFSSLLSTPRGSARSRSSSRSSTYRRLLRHGIFTSEGDLAEQMLAFIETYNQTAKPFKWTYTGKVLEA